VTHQEPVLPDRDADLYVSYLIHRESYAMTARHYGCDESSVRRRVRRYLDAQTAPGAATL
jgi:hypothetical protein